MAVALALFLGGCYRTDVLEPEVEGTPIDFDAGSMLLRDDVNTKTYKTTFVTDDQIAVFGRRYDESSNTTIFNRTPVTKNANGSWRYTDIKAWEWSGESDYYDFVAMYPSVGSTLMDIPDYMAVRTPYTLTYSSPDLLYAAIRRTFDEPNRTAVVPLEFYHALSAVRVVIKNDSRTTNITINSLKFTHVVMSAAAKVTLGVNNQTTIEWVDTERSTISSPWIVYPNIELRGIENSGNHQYDSESDYELFMIPSPLYIASDGSANTELMPHLYMDMSGSSDINILLKDIEDGEKNPISVWEPGVKYTYEITIRLDGGVLVNVVTTPWIEVDAETPGLLID